MNSTRYSKNINNLKNNVRRIVSEIDKNQVVLTDGIETVTVVLRGEDFGVYSKGTKLPCTGKHSPYVFLRKVFGAHYTEHVLIAFADGQWDDKNPDTHQVGHLIDSRMNDADFIEVVTIGDNLNEKFFRRALKARGIDSREYGLKHYQITSLLQLTGGDVDKIISLLA